MSDRAVILFAHGARDPRWAQPFHAVLEQLGQLRPDARVRLAFLELMSPSLDQALDELAAQGVTHIDVLPLFLGTGGHLRRDLPRLRDAAQQRHQGLTIRLLEAAGEHPLVTRALAELALRSLDDAGPA